MENRFHFPKKRFQKMELSFQFSMKILENALVETMEFSFSILEN